MNVKQIVVGFIICSFVACTNNAKQANTNNINNTNNTGNLKECKAKQDRIQSCVEKNMMKKDGAVDGIAKNIL